MIEMKANCFHVVYVWIMTYTTRININPILLSDDEFFGALDQCLDHKISWSRSRRARALELPPLLPVKVHQELFNALYAFIP